MDLRIISTEIIKPSSPTPHHLKTYKLSFIDQMLKDVYFPIIFFYSKVDKNATVVSDHLKKSLSEILVHYHPLAGRGKDGYEIDCDDSGVLFVETHTASEMSELLKRPEYNVLKQLTPPINLNEKPNLAIQLNFFGCGGVAISAYFGHGAADATTGAYFVRNWAALACGSNDTKCMTFDCTSIFPLPSDLRASYSVSSVEKETSPTPTECMIKLFTFDGSKVAILREKIRDTTGSCLYHPTRFEAVAAVIWSALIAIARQSNGSAPAAMIAVNIRNRMSPPLPPHCTGNIILPVTTKVMDHEATDDYSSLARRVHTRVKMVNGDYVSKVKEDEGFVDGINKDQKAIGRDEMFSFTSWGRLPFYETDFGWGKPTWVTTAVSCINVGVLFDACDGNGIEVWVGLSKNRMAKFLKNDGILTYASFDPTI